MILALLFCFSAAGSVVTMYPINPFAGFLMVPAFLQRYFGIPPKILIQSSCVATLLSGMFEDLPTAIETRSAVRIQDSTAVPINIHKAD